MDMSSPRMQKSSNKDCKYYTYSEKCLLIKETFPPENSCGFIVNGNGTEIWILRVWSNFAITVVSFMVHVITSYWSSVNSNIANTFVFDDEPPDTGPYGIWCDNCRSWPTENYQRKDCLDHQTVIYEFDATNLGYWITAIFLCMIFEPTNAQQLGRVFPKTCQRAQIKLLTELRIV